MALAIRLRHARLPVNSLQLRISKAVEQFYYVMLLSGGPNNTREVWRDWLAMGFNVAIKDAPPGTPPNDRVKITMRPPARSPEILVEGLNEPALRNLQLLLESIEGVRPALAGMSDDARVEALMTGAVGETLAQPAVQALLKHGFRPDEVDGYLTMMRRGLLALTHEQVQSLTVSSS